MRAICGKCGSREIDVRRRPATCCTPPTSNRHALHAVAPRKPKERLQRQQKAEFSDFRPLFIEPGLKRLFSAPRDANPVPKRASRLIRPAKKPRRALPDRKFRKVDSIATSRLFRIRAENIATTPAVFTHPGEGTITRRRSVGRRAKSTAREAWRPRWVPREARGPVGSHARHASPPKRAQKTRVAALHQLEREARSLPTAREKSAR